MDFGRDDVGLGLTTEQTDKILQFQDLTGIEDMAICRDVLQRHQWDLEVAVQEQLNIREGRPSMFATESRPPAVVSDHIAQHIFYSPPSDGSASGLRGFFRSIINFFVTVCYNTVVTLFQIGIRFIRADDRGYITDPLGDVLGFISTYEEKYGSVHPVFYQGTYSQALSDAKQELKFLLIYLHNDDNVDTALFCRNTLSNQQVITFINTNMLFWACSVKAAEGYRVSQSLRESHYPFLAVIVLKENRMTIVGRLEGFNNPEMLIARLQTIIRENEMCLVQARADRVERSLTQTLRAQQDEAYQESLRADQEKERRRALERQAILDEERRRREELEAEEARKRAIEQEKLDSVNKVPEEPDPTHPDAVHVVFKLPCGSRLDRRFLNTHSLESVFYFVFCHPLAPDSFEITTNFPKRVLHCRPTHSMERIQTLQEAGLKNREVLFINDLDA